MSGRKQFDVPQALDRAMEVFWTKGYAATSLDALGTATGLGRGSLYGAFGAKDDLFRSCLKRYASRFGEQQQSAVDAHADDPVGAIEAFFAVVLTRIADPTLPGGCLIAQSAIEAPTLTDASRDAVLVALVLQRARIRGALSSVDPETADELANFVVAVNQSLAVLSRSGAAPPELDVVARTACRAVASRLRPEVPGAGRDLLPASPAPKTTGTAAPVPRNRRGQAEGPG